MINMQWLYSDAMGGVRLQVPAAYAEKARELLAEDMSEVVELEQGSDSAVCSVCGSNNIEPYQAGRRWAFLVFLGLDFPLFPFKNTVRCKDCGHIERS